MQESHLAGQFGDAFHTEQNLVAATLDEVIADLLMGCRSSFEAKWRRSRFLPAWYWHAPSQNMIRPRMNLAVWLWLWLWNYCRSP